MFVLFIYNSDYWFLLSLLVRCLVAIGTDTAVLEANDVFFSQMLSALHLDQFHGDLLLVGEAVFVARWDVEDALVFATSCSSLSRSTRAVPLITTQCWA